MKVTVEFDCTPEEARRFMGLPDVEQVNKTYVDAMLGAMGNITNMDQISALARQVSPMGELGMKLFQNFLESARTATPSAPHSDTKSPNS